MPGDAAAAAGASAALAPPPWAASVDQPANPGPFPPPRPFVAAYRVRWGDVEAARGEAVLSLPIPGQLQTRVTAQTVGMARTLWQMTATHLSVANRADLRPAWTEHSETIASRQTAFRVDFGPDFVTRRFREGRPGETLAFSSVPAADATTERPRRFEFPGLRDMVTSFFYLRSQPLANGERHTVALMSAKNPYLAAVQVIGRGETQTRAGKFPAIELELTLQKIDKDGRLRAFKRFKGARVWISDNADRLLLKAETRVFIGHVTLELEQITFPPPPPPPPLPVTPPPMPVVPVPTPAS